MGRIGDDLGAMTTHGALRARITVAVAVGALLIAGGVGLLLNNTVGLRDTGDSAVGSEQFLLRVASIEKLVVDAETGLRGYVITGRPLFLAPLRAAQQASAHAYAALKQTADQQHAFIAQATDLNMAARSYMSVYVPTIVRLASEDLHAAQSFARTAAGKRVVDAIRARVARLERLISAQLTAREGAAHASADRSITEAILVLILLTGLTLLLGTALGRLAVARERARERSEHTADTLRRSLLPHELPKIPGCELAVRFTPAESGDLVGGDFYDIFELDSGRFVLVLGDVCGKGAEAATVTGMARWTLRAASRVTDTPAEALRFLNETMSREDHDLDGRFITIVYMLIDIHSDRADVAVACAGHPRPVYVPSEGEPSEVAAEGDLLGIWPIVHLHPAAISLQEGDSLVAYTDGVSDSGPELGPSPTTVFHDRRSHASAEQLAEQLDQHVRQTSGPHHDDIAILALRFLGAPHATGSDSSGLGRCHGDRWQTNLWTHAEPAAGDSVGDRPRGVAERANDSGDRQ